MTERTTTQLVGAALVGTAVGAGLALLFAPRSGKETREHLHERYDDLKQGAHQKMDRLKSVAHKTGKKAKAGMEEIRDAARDRKGDRQSPVLSAWEEEV